MDLFPKSKYEHQSVASEDTSRYVKPPILWELARFPQIGNRGQANKPKVHRALKMVFHLKADKYFDQF